MKQQHLFRRDTNGYGAYPPTQPYHIIQGDRPQTYVDVQAVQNNPLYYYAYEYDTVTHLYSPASNIATATLGGNVTTSVSDSFTTVPVVQAPAASPINVSTWQGFKDAINNATGDINIDGGGATIQATDKFTFPAYSSFRVINVTNLTIDSQIIDRFLQVSQSGGFLKFGSSNGTLRLTGATPSSGNANDGLVGLLGNGTQDENPIVLYGIEFRNNNMSGIIAYQRSHVTVQDCYGKDFNANNTIGGTNTPDLFLSTGQGNLGEPSAIGIVVARCYGNLKFCDDGLDLSNVQQGYIVDNVIVDTGQGGSGDGNAYKLGICTPTRCYPNAGNSIIRGNISIRARVDGFTDNNVDNGLNVFYNTSILSGGKDFRLQNSPHTLNDNISGDNDVAIESNTTQSGNSWQGVTGQFVASPTNLRPAQGSNWVGIGASDIACAILQNNAVYLEV